MTEIQEVGTAVAVSEGGQSPAAIFKLLERAVDQGVAVENLERLQALYERVTDRAAAQEFAEAMARFQAQVGPILHNKTADITSTRTGGSHSYTYATLDKIMHDIRPALIANGFTITWDTIVTSPGLLNVVCTCRHVNGQIRTASFPCPTETPASMSAAQKYASALKFAQRHSLIQVMGLLTSDQDMDGADPTTITEDQADDMMFLLETKGISLNRWLKYLDVEKLADVRVGAYEDSIKQLKNLPDRKTTKAEGA